MRTFSSAENRRRVRRWISRTTCSVLAPLPIRLLLPVGPGVSLSSTPYVVHIALTANSPERWRTASLPGVEPGTLKRPPVTGGRQAGGRAGQTAWWAEGQIPALCPQRGYPPRSPPERVYDAARRSVTSDEIVRGD